MASWFNAELAEQLLCNPPKELTDERHLSPVRCLECLQSSGLEFQSLGYHQGEELACNLSHKDQLGEEKKTPVVPCKNCGRRNLWTYEPVDNIYFCKACSQEIIEIDNIYYWLLDKPPQDPIVGPFVPKPLKTKKDLLETLYPEYNLEIEE